jgi:hypothetical protein
MAPHGTVRDRRLWDAWLDVSCGDLKLTPAAVLAAFPMVPGREPPPEPRNFLERLDAAESPPPPEYADDVRWLLAELAAGGPLRINCAGGVLELPDGETWGADRFALGGRPLLAGEVDIGATDQDDLYRSARFFADATPLERRGYRIPVPPGRWRVRLHFAEIEGKWPGFRRFDILLQGQVAAPDFDILAQAPFRAALTRDFETTVESGPLEILLLRSLDAAKPAPSRPQSSGRSPAGAILTRRGAKVAIGSTRSRCAAMTSSMSL